MATLELTYAEIRRFVGRYIGYDRDPASYTSTDQTADVRDAIREGLRAFYFNTAGHRWSFLKIVKELTLAVGQRTYDLPEDFGGIDLQFIPAANAKERPIGTVSGDDIRTHYANDDKSGFPKYVAMTPQNFVRGGRTVYQASFWPVPAVAATLNYRYTFEPSEVDADEAKPHGGAMHGRTILAACYMAGDEIINPEVGNGPMHERFEKLLQSSIAYDQSGGT